MRHAVFGRRLGRDINARKALLSNLASSLLEKGQITTTLAKAKFARPYVEKIITNAQRRKLDRNRVIASSITPKAFGKLREEIAPAFKDRPGGYTRIIKLNTRLGDRAPMARLELMEYEKPKQVIKSKQYTKKIQAKSKVSKPSKALKETKVTKTKTKKK
ncbi:50S ribosomal protein L17 [Candidatus Curtissbacteria bacterium]|nr:50S ribosomal protein L17 [Candidatus Curtissbacteria bacterium]